MTISAFHLRGLTSPSVVSCSSLFAWEWANASSAFSLRVLGIAVWSRYICAFSEPALAIGARALAVMTAAAAATTIEANFLLFMPSTPQRGGVDLLLFEPGLDLLEGRPYEEFGPDGSRGRNGRTSVGAYSGRAGEGPQSTPMV